MDSVLKLFLKVYCTLDPLTFLFFVCISSVPRIEVCWQRSSEYVHLIEKGKR